MAHFRTTKANAKKSEIEWMYDHLEGLGTACAIIKHRIAGTDKVRFTVWREGVEAIGAEDEGLTEYLPENIKDYTFNRKTYIEPQIVKECFDFGRISGLI